MKVDYLSKEQLFNSQFATEHFMVEGDNIERLWNLFSTYSNIRAKTNYERSSFDLIIKENRFNYGAMVLYRNDEPVTVTGLTDYNNWIIPSRLIMLKYSKYPITTAYLIPELIKKAKSDSKEGIACTFNTYNNSLKNFLNINETSKIAERSNRRILESEYHNHPMFSLSIEVKKQMKLLDHTVNYKNTEQSVIYYPFNNSTPPFDPYIKL